MLRIAVGSVVHEANTFTPARIEWRDFERHLFRTGEEVIAMADPTETAISGFLSAGVHDVEWVPLLSTGLPGGAGTLTVGVLDRLRHEFTSRIHAAGHLDACLLSIGGGMVAEREDLEDADGALLSAIRASLPGGCRLGVAVDMHANLTERMVTSADVMLAYQTFPPHWDKAAIGAAVTELTVGAVEGRIEPVMALQRVPMLVQPEVQDSLRPPMSDVLELAREAVATIPGLLAVSMVPGFAWCDVPEAGASVLVVADGDVSLARGVARRLGRRWFEMRERFRFPLASLDTAVERVLRHQGPRPLLVCDPADNVGAGGAGDSTTLLARLLEHDARNVAYAALCDEEAVARCVGAGIGATLELELGGKRDPVHGRPLNVTGTVRRISDGRYRNTGRLWTGRPGNLGRAVALSVEGIELVISERPNGGADPAVLTTLGIDPGQKTAVAIKSQVFGPKSYGDIVDDVIVVDGEGWATSNFSRLPYRRLRRPIFPLDPEVGFA